MMSPSSSSLNHHRHRTNGVTIEDGDGDGDEVGEVMSPGVSGGRGGSGGGGGGSGGGGGGGVHFEDNDDTNLIALAPGASIFYETLEKSYPNYHTIQDVSLSSSEMTVMNP